MVKVWVNGCFDVLHRGHFELFKYAKSLGDFLVVGIDSDQKVKQDKGSSRPYNKMDDRLFALNSIRYIDKVHYFDSKQGLEDLILFAFDRVLKVHAKELRQLLGY